MKQIVSLSDNNKLNSLIEYHRVSKLSNKIRRCKEVNNLSAVNESKEIKLIIGIKLL